MTEPLNLNKAKESLFRAADDVAKLARSASTNAIDHASDARSAAVAGLEKFAEKKADFYEEAIVEYNAAFTAMNDAGLSLLRQRERSADLIQLVEQLINSIANTPKSFDTAFAEISGHKANFVEAEEFARRDLEAARQSAAGAGAGVAAGAAVASMAPAAALWVATTFGAASTGTAISALSGAAATNAALAWLGGGVLAAGGGGTAAGGALLALAGPVGWSIAGAALLTSIALFAKKKFENREAKQEALLSLKQNTALVKGMAAQIGDLLTRSDSVRKLVLKSYGESLSSFEANFLHLSNSEQEKLASLVNATSACAALLGTIIEPEPAHE